MKFGFDRLGVRVTLIAILAWTKSDTPDPRRDAIPDTFAVPGETQ